MVAVVTVGVRSRSPSPRCERPPGDWVPTGDDAYFTVRSRDVLTDHHPLLGAWSSGSLDLANPINNLGPMQLDLLAPFTKVAPMGGTAIAVGAHQHRRDRHDRLARCTASPAGGP